MKTINVAIKTVLLLSIFSSAIIAYGSNHIEIKPGISKFDLYINIQDNVNIDNATVIIDTAPIYSGVMENKSITLNHSGNHFWGSIPLETSEEIVGLRFFLNESGFGSMVKLYTEQPLTLIYTLNNNLDLLSWESSDPNAIPPQLWADLSAITSRFFGNHNFFVPDSAYASWENVRDYEMKTMWPAELKSAFDEITIPAETYDWLINILKCRFASIEILPYVQAAERMNGLSVKAPPMEAYVFLDSIKYDSTFLIKLPFSGLKPFLSALLRFPCGGFEPIGEIPVHIWQRAFHNKISPAIKHPSQLLLDLATGMSYVMQLENERTPLTPNQINEIKRGLSNSGISTILFNINQNLLKSIEDEINSIDIADENFSIEMFIDTYYPNSPIVVDLWNTWCAPCLDTFHIVDSAKKEFSTQGIVFLYICDSSSTITEWRNKQSLIQGVHLRIPETTSHKIGQTYNLQGFPTLLFFDSNHNLKSSITGTPTKDQILQNLSDIYSPTD